MQSFPGLTGEETYDILGLKQAVESRSPQVQVRATATGGVSKEFAALVRIDTPQETLYYQHGGILQYVLRQLLGNKA